MSRLIHKWLPLPLAVSFKQSSQGLANRIRSSVNYLSLIGRGGGSGSRNLKGVSTVSDEGLVQLLVKKTAAGRDGSCKQQ